MTTADARRWLAEDLRVSHNIRSGAVLEAFAAVSRDRFLPPPPWTMRGYYEGGAYSPEGSDPSLVHHNVSVAIDPTRDLYNGQPALIARWLDDLAIPRGARVVHIGAGTGYFTAILGEMVGPAGRVSAVEVDPRLAARARENVREWPWIHVAEGDGRGQLPAEHDVVLVHAGATHVLDVWLDGLADGGRLLVPLTAAMPAMGAHLGKGVMLLVTRTGQEWRAQVSSFVAIYSLVGSRDEAMNVALGQALMGGGLTKATRVRRDRHEPASTCLLHGPTNCLE